ncbi:MAG: hypothetical protein J0L92_09140 [Deltaproteobacteria bacterium]|nr:hypothetical protein [Deltaproteobacteria bacterium]
MVTLALAPTILWWVAALPASPARAQEARGLLAVPPVSSSIEVGAAPGIVRPGIGDAGPLGVGGVDLRVAPIPELAIHAAVDLAWDALGADVGNPYLGVAWIVDGWWSLELGTSVPLTEGTDRLFALGASLDPERSFRLRRGELTPIVTARALLPIAGPVFVEGDAHVGVAIPVDPRGVLGVPLGGSLRVGGWLRPLRFEMTASLNGITGSLDAAFALRPAIAVALDRIAEIEAFALLEIAGGYGSSFTGDPWSAGVALRFPAQRPLEVAQCHGDDSCGGWGSCEIIPACEMCDGGPTYCVDRDEPSAAPSASRAREAEASFASEDAGPRSLAHEAHRACELLGVE